MRTLLSTLVLLAIVFAPASSQQWQTVRSWSGEGIQSTESFSVSDREWRIRWQSRVSGSSGILQVYVYDASTEDLVTLAANVQGSGSSTSYVRHNPGRFYLEINSANVDWRVEVQTRSTRQSSTTTTPASTTSEPDTPSRSWRTYGVSTESSGMRVLAALNCELVEGAAGGVVERCGSDFVQLVFLPPVGREVFAAGGRLMLSSGDSESVTTEMASVEAGPQELAWVNVPVDFFENFVRTGGSGYSVASVNLALDRNQRARMRSLLSRLP